MALTSAQMAQINGSDSWTIKLVEITSGTTVYRYTDHYGDVTSSSNTYSSMNELKTVSTSKVSTRATQTSTMIRFGAVDAAWRLIALSGNLIGAQIVISRAFLDGEGVLIGPPLPRIEGTIWGLDATDDYQDGQATVFDVTFDIRPETSDLLTRPFLSTNSRSHKRFTASANDDIFSLVEASANKNVVLI